MGYNRELLVFLINVLMSMGKAAKRVEYFLAFIFTTLTDRMHTHTLSQNEVFMKVANALIHGGE